jgi:phosphoribosylamine-glycine ligase
MRILLASSGGMGCWFLLRLMHEGHQCDWFILDDDPRPYKRVLKGMVPRPIEDPDFESYDLVIFDSTGHGDLADKIREVTPVLGDGELSSRLEDDRLYGIEVMEECGIEVPFYETFDTPDEARAFIESNPKRYVYKPSTPPGEEQGCATTYVSESAEDMLACLDELYAESMQQPFLLQEVVEGTEISVEAWFDGSQFHFINYTLEEKKFMAGGFGPNTGCSGNLVWVGNGRSRLFDAGLGKLQGFLSANGYRGMVDLNTIVNGLHAYGIEWTPRFGYDASASIYSTIKSGLGEFFLSIASAPDGGWEHDIEPRTRCTWAASTRYSIPPYPAEVKGGHPSGLPIKGVSLEDAWMYFYMYDAMLEEGELVTAGVNGFVGSPIACGHTPEGAWEGVAKMEEKIRIPNMQARNDLKERTLKRLKQVMDMGWL